MIRKEQWEAKEVEIFKYNPNVKCTFTISAFSEVKASSIVC